MQEFVAMFVNVVVYCKINIVKIFTDMIVFAKLATRFIFAGDMDYVFYLVKITNLRHNFTNILKTFHCNMKGGTSEQ